MSVAKVVPFVSPITTPLIYEDAINLAQGAMVAWRESERVDQAEYHIARVLMAVDVASRLQAQTADSKLLGDVLDLLTELSEWASKEADCDQDAGGHQTPNQAMRFQCALERTDLVERVRKAWQRPIPEPVARVDARIKTTCTDDYADSPTQGWKVGA